MQLRPLAADAAPEHAADGARKGNGAEVGMHDEKQTAGAGRNEMEEPHRKKNVGAERPGHPESLAVADVYDAMVSDRPYRAGYPVENVIQTIVESSGSHFDPEVVEAFLRVMAEEDKQLPPPVHRDQEAVESP